MTDQLRLDIYKMQMLTQLPSEPVRLTNFGLGQFTRDPNSGCILDFIKKGLPLLLTFGFAEWKGLARFDFWERSKKYEKKIMHPLIAYSYETRAAFGINMDAPE